MLNCQHGERKTGAAGFKRHTVPVGIRFIRSRRRSDREEARSGAKAYGLIYLRDRSVLKPGEEWMPAIIGHINKADIFQLCWSTHAKRSKYVNKEWKHALGLKRHNFIRPVYWEKPMPSPPRALKQIEFTKMEW
jgi:hypothetical protein